MIGKSEPFDLKKKVYQALYLIIIVVESVLCLDAISPLPSSSHPPFLVVYLLYNTFIMIAHSSLFSSVIFIEMRHGYMITIVRVSISSGERDRGENFYLVVVLVLLIPNNFYTLGTMIRPILQP